MNGHQNIPVQVALMFICRRIMFLLFNNLIFCAKFVCMYIVLVCKSFAWMWRMIHVVHCFGTKCFLENKMYENLKSEFFDFLCNAIKI